MRRFFNPCAIAFKVVWGNMRFCDPPHLRLSSQRLAEWWRMSKVAIIGGRSNGLVKVLTKAKLRIEGSKFKVLLFEFLCVFPFEFLLVSPVGLCVLSVHQRASVCNWFGSVLRFVSLIWRSQNTPVSNRMVQFFFWPPIHIKRFFYIMR